MSVRTHCKDLAVAQTVLDILRDLKNKKRMAPMAQQDIQGAEIPASDLYFFKVEDKEVGPYYKIHIKEYIDEFKSVAETCYLRGFQEQQYTLLYEHKEFSRRGQASNIQIDNYKQAKYLYLRKGEKKGPISFDELEEQVKQTDIIRTDQISLDRGKTWIKVYQLPCFDRRSPENRKKVNLPYMPSSETFDGDAQSQKKHPKQVEQALVDLAILGHVGVAKDKIVQPPIPTEENLMAKQNASLTRWVAGFCFFVAVAAGWIFSDKIPELPLPGRKTDTKKSLADKIKAAPQKKNYKVGTPQKVSTQKIIRKAPQVRNYKPKREPSSARRKPQIRRKFPTEEVDDRPIYDEPEDDLYQERDEYKDEYADNESLSDQPQKKAKKTSKRVANDEDEDYYDDEEEENARDIAADDEANFQDEPYDENAPEEDTFDEEVDY